MNRRKFLHKIALVGTSAAAMSFIPKAARAQKKVRWRLAAVVPKTLPIWGPGLERFAQNVETLTNGNFKIRVYGAGELVPALGTFDAVRSGELQMGHSAAYYWQGKIPAAAYFTAMPFGLSANGLSAWLQYEGQALWDELLAPHGILSIPCGNTGAQPIGWYRKKINSLEDIKGLKVRIPGIASKVFQKAGASPVLLPGGELYTSLATGVIDAVEWVGPYHDSLMGFHKAAKFYYGTSWHESSSQLELMINKKAWEGLDKNYQLAVKIAASETDYWMRTNWEAKNAEYFQKLKKEGAVKLLQLPKEVLAAFREHTKTIQAEIAATSPIAQKIDASYKRFQSIYSEYTNWLQEGL